MKERSKAMKKFLCVLLTLILICVPMSIVANAEEFVDSAESNYEGQTDFDYHVYSYYFVTIPTHIDADSYGELSVTMGYIENGYHIEAYVSNVDEQGLITVYADDYNTSNVTAKVGVIKDVLAETGSITIDSSGLIGMFYPADYGQYDFATTTIGFTKAMGDNILPGVYHGTICFRIECMPD